MGNRPARDTLPIRVNSLVSLPEAAGIRFTYGFLRSAERHPPICPFGSLKFVLFSLCHRGLGKSRRI